MSKSNGHTLDVSKKPMLTDKPWDNLKPRKIRAMNAPAQQREYEWQLQNIGKRKVRLMKCRALGHWGYEGMRRCGFCK